MVIEINDDELELAILQRYVEQYKTAQINDPDRKNKCDSELDMSRVISEITEDSGASLKFNTALWLNRLAPLNHPPTGPLRRCSNSTLNQTTHKFHARAYIDPTGKIISAWDKIRELETKIGQINPRRSIMMKDSAPQTEKELKNVKDKKIKSEEDIKIEVSLHPIVIKNAYGHFLAGNFREAVLNAFIAVFDFIRKRTGLKKDGQPLFRQTFSLDNPKLIFSDLETDSGKSDQAGFLQIFEGAYAGIRNPNSHTLEHDLTKEKAIEYLIFASLLARKVSEAKAVKVKKKKIFEIIEAIYWSKNDKDKKINVTEEIKKMIKNGRVTVMASNQYGDPNKGVGKRLTIKYKYGKEILETTIKEKETISLP